MASKPPAYFSELDKLIERAEVISNSLYPHVENLKKPKKLVQVLVGGIVHISQETMDVDYKKWNMELRQFFIKNKLEGKIPKNFFMGEKIEYFNPELRRVVSGSDRTTFDRQEVIQKESIKQFYLELYQTLQKQIEKIKEIRGELLFLKKDKNADCFWITKNKGGDYHFVDDPIYIKNKESDYAIIFDVVFSLIPKGGKVDYSKIIDGCKARRLKANKRSIQRVLTGESANFFKYVKINPSPAYGINLFTASQNGKYLEFNNKI